MQRKPQKYVVRQLINLIQSGLKEYTFEQILAALPEALNNFDDEQIKQLLTAIEDYRKIGSNEK